MLKLFFSLTLLSATLLADWSNPIPVSTGPTSINFGLGGMPLSINSNSVALAGWLDGLLGAAQTLSSSMLTPQATVWTPQQFIFKNTNPAFFPVFPTMSQDIFGRSQAAFTLIDIVNLKTIINASRREAGIQNWQAPIALDLGGFVGNGSGIFDDLGNLGALLAITHTGAPPFDITLIQLLADSPLTALAAKTFRGQSTLAWKVNTPSLQIQTMRYNLLTQQPSSIILAPVPAGSTDILTLDIAVDTKGDAILLILAENGAGNSLYSSTLLSGSTTWSQPLLISNPSNTVVGASIAADSTGTATIFWGEQVMVGQQFVRATTLPLGSTHFSVTNLTPSTLGTTVNAASRVVMDSFGNAAAIWTLMTGGQNLVQVSSKPVGKKWTSPITLYNQGITPVIALSDQGTAVAAWRDNFTTILFASRNLFLFRLTPPSNFIANLRINKFLNKTERFLVFTWNPSPAPNILNYKILRNGVVIATIGPTGPFTFFLPVDSDVVEGTFKLIATASNGNQSIPIRATPF